MTKTLKKRRIVLLMYCLVVLLLAVLSRPAGAVNDGWVKLLGTALTEFSSGIAVDSAGNIYVTGFTEGQLGGEFNSGAVDIFLAKYDGKGIRQWVKLLGTASGEVGCGVVVDSAGAIYVTGYTMGNLGGETNAGGQDIFLAKYDGSGTRQWVKLLGTKSLSEGGSGLATGPNDSIYVTGYTDGNLGETNAGGEDVFLAKYDGSGTREWVKLLGTTQTEEGTGVAVDSVGSIYVTGFTRGDLGGETNAGGVTNFLAKYDGVGTRQWVKLLGSAMAGYSGIALDPGGNIYVAGITCLDMGGETNAGDYDIFLAKYDGSGTKQWVKLLGTEMTDSSHSVVVDSVGAIYITGGTRGNLGGETNAGGEDIFLAKYDSSGARQWVKLLGTISWEDGNGMAADASGNIYITGNTGGNLDGKINAGGEDIFMWKYSESSESFPWEIFYPAIMKKRQ